MKTTKILGIIIVSMAFTLTTGYSKNNATIDQLADKVEPQVIQWRRHFHQNPELSNREFKTAATIAEHLKKMGLEVTTGIAHTGVVAILDSGNPGPVIALRADIDGLPVIESAPLPFASKAKSTYNGNEVGVMHACGHDTHIAMLLGAAKILTQMKSQLKGKVKFIFQPAEEGPPEGEQGGAELMVKQNVLKNPDVDVIFGLHVLAGLNVGTVAYRYGGIMASVDTYKIIVKGKQSHGAYPWDSIDPIVTSAQIIMGLQTIVSRNVNFLKAGAVVSVGSIHGGVRSNIIPSKVELVGTIRNLDKANRKMVLDLVRHKAKTIAESMGATAEVILPFGNSYPITYNDPKLMAEIMGTLENTAGKENVVETPAVFGAEDFSFFQQEIPGVYLFVGGKALDMKDEDAPSHHTPEFIIDESGMKLGVRLLVNLVMDYEK
ncbi:MAG: amidohydrolase [Methylococcales bacterium]